MARAEQLGRYLLLDRLAFGGMAEIYRARTYDAEAQPHMVAIKKVLGHLLEDEDFLQMLVDEARIAALLHHENIGHVYELSRVGDEYFIAMEYVDGKDMRTALERHRQAERPFPLHLAVHVMMKVLRGLHAAHTRCDGAGRNLGIVHRDVSPSNVLVSYTGEVKLIDFGIAKATLSRVQTKTGVIKGKVKYMSPEQALGRKVDARSDLFSAGAVLYELLTLRPPFAGVNEMQLLFRVRDARCKPLRELRADAPAEVEQIVHKAMSRSRSARFQTACEFADALEDFLDRHHPGPVAHELGRYLRDLFAEDIERELRVLEDYVVAEAYAGDLGENLIGDQDPQGPWTKFTPVRPDQVEDSAAAGAGGTSTEPSPPGEDLHAAPTRILRPEDRAALRATRDGAPAGPGYAGVPAPAVAGAPPGDAASGPPRRPLPMSREFHEAPTQIIKRPARR